MQKCLRVWHLQTLNSIVFQYFLHFCVRLRSLKRKVVVRRRSHKKWVHGEHASCVQESKPVGWKGRWRSRNLIGNREFGCERPISSLTPVTAQVWLVHPLYKCDYGSEYVIGSFSFIFFLLKLPSLLKSDKTYSLWYWKQEEYQTNTAQFRASKSMNQKILFK